LIIEPVHEERYKFVIVEYGRLIQDDFAEAIEVKCIPGYLLHVREGSSIISLCLSDLCEGRVWEKIPFAAEFFVASVTGVLSARIYRGNYRGDTGSISGTGVVIQVDRTGVKACSIRVKCIDKIQEQNNARRALQQWGGLRVERCCDGGYI